PVYPTQKFGGHKMFESTLQFPAGFAMFQDIFHAPDPASIMRIIFRWTHFVAGITWIGMLYFFNLVNVNFMKALDAPTKKVVVPELMPKALWYFRWGAVVTVLAGMAYYAMYLIPPDVKNANSLGNAGANTWLVFFGWLAIAVVFWLIYFFILPRIGDGKVLAVVTAVIVILMSVVIVWCLNEQLLGNVAGREEGFASNKTLSIGIGGALGVFMMLNVWGIIWPAQKRIIAGTVSGTPAPPELARRAFLASRTNAWLSLPMLFFMATSHGDYVILGRN
ncbi:MAG TPA: urate hydroxylase PuuD, partial [Thermoanaerobaculia bacterium]|nr:urate hydroxylase PuuD [Thermoanaerobaculia bacterium]